MNQQVQTAFVKASSYVELAPIVDKASEGITFFGYRYIHVQGFNGTLSIHDLSLKVMLLANRNIDFSKNLHEREALEKIIPKVSAIYKNNSKRWNNPLTAIFAIARAIIDSYNEYKYSGMEAGIRFAWQVDYTNEVNGDGFNFSKKSHPPLSEWLLSQMTKENIQHVLPTITTFTDLLSVAKKAKGDVSFFGWRHISVEGYDGTLPITALSQRVAELARTRLSNAKNDHTPLLEADDDNQQSASISTEEREAYREIKPLIDAVYQESHDRVTARNIFTRILCLAREIFTHCIKGNNDMSRLQWEMHKNTGYDLHEVL